MATTDSTSSCLLDPTLPGCNSCNVPSLSPNCSDPFCTERICGALNQTQCCEVAWDESCSLAASQICIPEVLPMYSNETACPLGFVCHEDLTYKASCNEIRQIPITYKLGDVFGGVYCPNGAIGMRNCREGKYCPQPDQQLICPKGKYCPHKSTRPLLNCPTCPEGATDLKRDFTGLIVMAVGVTIILFVLIVLYLRQKYKDAIAKKLQLLNKRPLMFSHPQQKADGIKTIRQDQLNRLRPKLAVIAKRLNDIERDKHKSSKESSEYTDGQVHHQSDELKFDVREVFDVLDKNGDGVLQYSELNAVLGFDERELELFVGSMSKASNNRTSKKNPNETLDSDGDGQQQQQEAVLSATSSVTRPIFVNNFLRALEGVTSLQVSPVEAASTYDSILEAHNNCKVLRANMLYSSSLSNFLSEIEILQLIKKFRSIDSSSADDESPSSRQSLTRRAQLYSSRATSAFAVREDIIKREDFIKYYPTFLLQVSSETAESLNATTPGIDIRFENLSLQVSVEKKKVNVVNEVNGRLRAKTMTALMGGSGAGKTSLLNALCGRAHYGKVLGDIHINGKKMEIDEIKNIIGFVPQDDVVYADLTVRENLLYAGKLMLPRCTTLGEIEDLADTTLANLGLVRVANSLVGDVKRRGVSGGEKKRVNIGLELMAKPACLFLDEPTSGLDSSSAMLVMSSLKSLVSSDGVTVVTVIHQPRKFIFDLFDSLILLGFGGNTVYSGPALEAYDYFRNLDYVLPEGEALADWLIDISCGEIHPDHPVAPTKNLEPNNRSNQKEEDDLVRLGVMNKRLSSVKFTEAMVSTGFAVGKVEEAIEDASLRREWLFQKWKRHFSETAMEQAKLSDIQEARLPEITTKPSFLSQLAHQLERAALVSKRNAVSKLFDTVVLLVAATVISVVSGLPKITDGKDPSIPFETIAAPTEDGLHRMVVQLFRYAATMQLTFPLQIGLITAVLLGLQSSKALTNKRMEFFRETSSGIDPNAYFLAINLVVTTEAIIQMTLVAFVAAFLREPVASWSVFFVHFIVLAWLCVSWALFFAMIIPAENVTTVIGFFMAFFGMLLSGAVPPVNFEVIYEGGIVEHLSAWLSPTRFFVEGLTVSEHRCLPEQSGWTVSDASVNFDRQDTLMYYGRFSYAIHDPNATRESCDGFYWGVLPSVFVGLTVRCAAFIALHVFNRAKQTKKPLWHEIKTNRMVVITMVLVSVLMIVLISVTVWLYTRDIEPEFEYYGLDQRIGEDVTLASVAEALGLESIPNLFDLNEQLDLNSVVQ